MRVVKVVLTLLCMGIGIGFLCFKNCLMGENILFLLLAYFFSSILHVWIHECGHFIGGTISGYKLLYLQLGPMTIVLNNARKIKVLWNKSLKGQCVMIPQRTDSIRFMAYNMGGICANTVLVALGIVMLTVQSFFGVLVGIELIGIGIKKILVNAIPHKTDSRLNDGYVIKILKKNSEIQKDYAIYLDLYGKLFLGETIFAKDYSYKRKETENKDELLYYYEIQNMLQSLDDTGIN